MRAFEPARLTAVDLLVGTPVLELRVDLPANVAKRDFFGRGRVALH